MFVYWKKKKQKKLRELDYASGGFWLTHAAGNLKNWQEEQKWGLLGLHMYIVYMYLHPMSVPGPGEHLIPPPRSHHPPSPPPKKNPIFFSGYGLYTLLISYIFILALIIDIDISNLKWK